MKNTNELIYDILLGEGPSSLTADQHEELKSSLTSALALMSKFDKGLRMVGADLITGREHFRYAGAKYHHKAHSKSVQYKKALEIARDMIENRDNRDALDSTIEHELTKITFKNVRV